MAEDRALELAVDLLEEAALQAAVGDVAPQHLALERTVVEQDRVRRGVGDLVVRHPQHGLRDRLGVERAGRVGEVVEEAVLLDLDHLVRRQPGTLVVVDEDAALGAEADAVRRAQAAGDRRDLPRAAADLDRGARRLARLRVGRRAAVVDGDGAGDVEVVVVVDEAEGELVEVAAVGPRRERACAPSGRRRRRRRASSSVSRLALGDVPAVADDLDAHRVRSAPATLV